MEAPGVDFGGSGARFSKVLDSCKWNLRAFPGGKHFATNLSYIIGPFEGEKWPRSCRATGRLPRMPLLPCPGSDGRGAHGVGGRRCPPPRGLSINAKNVLFFNIGFFGFRPRFRKVLAFQDGTKLAKNRIIHNEETPPWSMLS